MSKIKQLGKKHSDDEQALRESETRRNLALEAAKMGTFLWHPQEDRGEPDARMLALFGLSDSDRLNLAEALAKMIHPDDRTFYAEEVAKAVDPRSDGKLYAEIRVIHPDSSLHWIAVTAQTLFEGEPPQPMRMYGTAADITQLKHREANLAFLDAITEEFSLLSNPKEILRVFGERLVAFLGVASVSTWSVNVEGDEIHRLSSFEKEGTQPLPFVAQPSNFINEDLVRTMRAGKVLVMRDTRSDLRADAEAYARLKLLAFVAVPFHRHGVWRELLAVTEDRTRDWHNDEIELLIELSNRLFLSLERARSQQALRRSEEKYSTLFDSIDEGFVVAELLFDEKDKPFDLLVLETNPSFDRMMRTTDAVGKRALEIFPNAEASWFEAYGRVVETGESLRFENYLAELDRWFDLYISRIGEASSCHFAIVFNDITERKRREANLAFLNEVSLDLVGLTSIDEMMNRLGAKIGRFFDVKHCMFAEHTDELKTAVVAYGWNAEDAPNLKGTYRMRDFLSDEMMAALLTGKPLIVSETQSDARVNAESYGDLGIRSFIIVPLVREGEWRFQISIIDDKPRDWRDDEIELIGELTTRIWMRLERAHAENAMRESQKQLQAFNKTLEQSVQEKTAEIRQLAADLLKATQRERQRISRVLHDDLQQRIYAIQMQLSFLRNELPTESETARREASDVEKELSEIVTIMRDLSLDLSPPILPGEGLSHAIEWLATRMREQYALSVELQANGAFVISNEDLHVFLFNCVRELLFNVVKHAGASRAVVAMAWLDHGLQIEVRDNGKGFPVGTPEEEISKQNDLPRSLGLPTIRHQLSLFGGVMEINSKHRIGTQVTLFVPVAEAHQ